MEHGTGRQDEFAAWLAPLIPPDHPQPVLALMWIRDMRDCGVEMTEEIVANAFARARSRSLIRKRAARSPEIAPSVVYYMLLGNRVKIGTSTNLRLRMLAINPEKLLAVEPGDHKQRAAPA